MSLLYDKIMATMDSYISLVQTQIKRVSPLALDTISTNEITKIINLNTKNAIWFRKSLFNNSQLSFSLEGFFEKRKIWEKCTGYFRLIEELRKLPSFRGNILSASNFPPH
jgi:hypothetical protein